jgi:hypothetical protein
MERESPQAEVLRLLKELNKARDDEIFGGLSAAERADYNRKAARIGTIFHSRFAEADARQSDAWDQTSERDTPQSKARKPYRDREREKDARDSQKESRRQKNTAADGGVTNEE